MSQPVVLIVDDEPKIFHAVRRALHRESYELIYAPAATKRSRSWKRWRST